MLNDIDKASLKLSDISKFVCEIFPLTKYHRLPFSHSKTKTTRPFEIISLDIWGPTPSQAYDGCKYFLTIVNQFTWCTWIYTLKVESKARVSLHIIFSIVENQFETHIKIIRSNNGPSSKADSLSIKMNFTSTLLHSMP